MKNMNNAISELKELLSLSNCPKEQGDFFGYFKEIADLLMNKCIISKGEVKYEIVEIEFYLFTPSHKDIITYPRGTKAGQWFFHQSGVDLTFEGDENHFGGILIRGIREVGGLRKMIFGPIRCVDELWDVFGALDREQKEYPVIEAFIFKNEKCEPSSFPRWIPLVKKVNEIGGYEVKRRKLEAIIKHHKDYIAKHQELMLADIYECLRIDVNIIETVFSSNYRFFKMEAIDQKDEAWKKYAAKPSGLTK